MSADLHIHVVTNKSDLPFVREYLDHDCWSSDHQNYCRSYFYLENGARKRAHDVSEPEFDQIDRSETVPILFSQKEVDAIVDNTDNIWVGEVSWLKAALFEDRESFVPDVVNAVSDIVGRDLPVIDESMIAHIRAAFDLPNKTAKPDGVWGGRGYALATVDDVVEFLEARIGCWVFTISW